MILVMAEKQNNEFKHFAAMTVNPETVLEKIRGHTTYPVSWMIKLADPIIQSKWFNYSYFYTRSKAAALLSIWLTELLEKGKQLVAKAEKRLQE